MKEKPTIKNTGKNTLYLEGDISINNIEPVRKKMLRAQLNKEITVIFNNITQFDVAGAQLVVAFYRNCIKNKTDITLEWSFPEEINLLLSNTGINKIFSNLNSIKI